MKDYLIKSMLESMPVSVICIANDNLWMNNSAEKLIGYTNEEIKHKDDWKKILMLEPGSRDVNSHLKNIKIKAGIIQKDCSVKNIEIALKEHNGIENWIVYPPSEEKFLEDNLRDRDKILSVIYDSTSDMMFLVSIDGSREFIFLSVNNTFMDITGLAKTGCTGKTPDEIFNKDISEIISKAFLEVLNTKEKVKIEFSGLFGEKNFYFDASFKPILDLSGRCVYILVIARNITDRKKKEDELLKNKILADESNRLKTTLLSNLSHEFRTPLNGILGFAELLADELTNPGQKEMAHNISKSGKRLYSTLNSILELSRLETERKEVYNTSIRLGDVVKEIEKKFRLEASSKGLFFNIEIKSPSLKLHLDESILIQIIQNLVDNAIKFTKKGGVNIIVEELFLDLKTYAVIRVIDTGIGISKENIGLIFKEFKQVSEGISRSHEGTGLGLTIAKKMTELMGGEILVESCKGKGSVFSLKFPAMGNRIERTTIGSVHRTSPLLKPAKKTDSLPFVLLVEDNELNSKLTTVYLKDHYTVDSVQNAEDALHLLEEKTYSAILLDVNLGEGLNGVDIAQTARSMKKYFDTPIIAITGYAFNNDKENLLKCGFSHYLSKPYSKNQLLELIGAALIAEAI